VVEMHAETAAALGIEDGDMVTVETDAGAMTAPALIYIGIRPDTIAIAQGRGHGEAAGRYAVAGASAMALVTQAEDARSGAAVYGATRARLAKATGAQRIVTTEGSGRQHGRGIAQATTVASLI